MVGGPTRKVISSASSWSRSAEIARNAERCVPDGIEFVATTAAANSRSRLPVVPANRLTAWSPPRRSPSSFTALVRPVIRACTWPVGPLYAATSSTGTPSWRARRSSNAPRTVVDVFIAPAATAGPTTFAASSSLRSVFGSLSCATIPADRVDAAAASDADFGDLADVDLLDDDFDDGDADDAVGDDADFVRALRRSATLLLPRAGGYRTRRKPKSAEYGVALGRAVARAGRRTRLVPASEPGGGPDGGLPSSVMTPPTGTDAIGGDAGVRLGPSAAGRCRRRIHLDAAYPEQRASIPAAAQRALDELAEHRRAVLSAVGLPPNPPTAAREPPDGALWRTTPQSVVPQPRTETASRSGSPDLLIWRDDGYLPVIIRAHRTRDAGAGALTSAVASPSTVGVDPGHRTRRNRGDRLALAHHYRQLAELGCASSTARGGVIGVGSPTDGAGRRGSVGGEDDSAVIVWHRLDSPESSVLAEYDRRFTDRIAVATAAVAGGRPLAAPSRIAECRRCPWWPRCRGELTASRDISLLLTGDDVDTARAAGVLTIDDLAALTPEPLAALRLTVANAGLARVRARASLSGVPLVRVGPRSAVRRADVEVDVDAESYGEDGAYLWGATLSGAEIGLPRGYRSFVTWEPMPSPRQGAVFGEFFGYLLQVRAAAAERGLSFAAFCYARQAEERWMLGLARRYARLPGVPDPAEVSAFCASDQWVDLLLEIRRQFVVPGSLRLKELAGAMGFRWRDPEPGGENSMAWYRAAVAADSSMNDAGQMAARLLRYNEDDVLATLAVRDWITRHRDDLPTVAELEADPPTVG